jgi:GNAT superfamily N-acetyltransferase
VRQEESPGLLKRFGSVAGSVGLLRAAAVTPVWAVSRRFVVCTRDLADVPAGGAGGWERIGREAVALIPRVNPLVSAEGVERLLEQGATCVVVREDGRIVHYRWYSESPVWLPFLSLLWVPEPGDYITLGVYTIPQYRGRGMHQRFSIEGFARARHSGLRRSVSLIAWWNAPALAVIRGVGFHRVGTATLWKVGPWSRHTAGGAAVIRDGRLRVLPAIS